MLSRITQIDNMLQGKFLIKLIFCFLIPFSGLAQKLNYDELSADELHDSLSKYLISNQEKAFFFGELCEKKAKEDGNIEKQGLVIEAYSILHLYDKNIDQAIFESERLMAFAKKHENDVLLIHANLLGGDLQFSIPNSSKAITYYNAALEIAKKSNNDLLREVTLSKLASLHIFSEDHAKAIVATKKNVAFYSSRQIDSLYTRDIKDLSIIKSLLYLSISYQKIDQLDSAKYYHNRLKLVALDGDSCLMYFVHLNQAEHFKEAKRNYQKTLDFCPPASSLFWLNHAYRLGKVEHGMRNFSAAIQILEDGLAAYEVTPEEEGYMLDYYEIIADSYKENGNFEKAHFYFEKYLNTKDEFSKIKDDVNTSLRAQELADYKSELNKLARAKNIQNNYLNYVLLGSSILILGLLFLLLRFYRLRKKDELRFNLLMNKLNTIEQTKPVQPIVDSKDTVLEEKSTNEISEEIKTQIIDGLKYLEEKEYFLSVDCNSYNVAKKIKTNTTYLSKVLNMEFEKNFNTYINDLRINYAIVRLKNDRQFRSYSIQAIAEELGYKSGDSFAKYFKLHTQLNPSFYIKQLKLPEI